MIKSKSIQFKYFFFLLIGTVLLSSCFSPAEEPTQIIDIENDLGLELLQKLNTENEFYWLISTNESNFCKESQLNTDYIIDDNLDVLVIRGIETPNKCSAYQSQIRSIEEMKMHSENKNLVINIADKVTYASTLAFEDDMITILSSSENAFSPRESYLQRVDDNHMWGGLYNTTEQNKALFFDLYRIITESIIYDQVEQGNHGYFSYKNSSLRVMNPESFETTNLGFALKIDDEFVIDQTELENIVLDFRLSHPEVDFFISLGNGKQF